MKVKITSNGDPFGTRITTGDGGDISDRVKAVSWRHDASSLPTAELELSLIQFEVEGEAAMVAPNGKRVRRIEYEDGSADTFTTEGVESSVRP